MRSGRKAAGFTLIEVLIALVILGLVLSTGFQILRNSSNRLLSETRALELVAYAESVWRGLEVTGSREAASLQLNLPDELKIDVNFEPADGRELGDWIVLGNLDWVVLTIANGSEELSIEGLMVRRP